MAYWQKIVLFTHAFARSRKSSFNINYLLILGNSRFACKIQKPYPLWSLVQSSRGRQVEYTGRCRLGNGRSPASLAKESQTRTSRARSRSWRSRTETCTAVWARPNRPDRRERKGSRGTFVCRDDIASEPEGSRKKLAAGLHSWFRGPAGLGGASLCTLYHGTGGTFRELACSYFFCSISHAGQNCIIRGWLPCRVLLSPTTLSKQRLSFSMRVKNPAESGFVEHQSAWMEALSVASSYCDKRFSSRHVWEESVNCV